MFCNRSFLLAATLCVLLSLSCCLQAQLGSNGGISGVARAADGSPITGASMTVSGADGLLRSTSTGPEGTFSLPGLPSGSYTVQALAPGFATLVQPSVPVATGRSTQLTLTLLLAGNRETVSVTAAQSAFDRTETSSVVNIDRDRVEELPIPSRNYLSFVALSPQAAPANPALSASAASQAGGGFGFGGLRPGSNAVRIDGVPDDDEYTGSPRTQLSPEAINDFQIVNHGFSAESGGAAGGAIDVQTRSGLQKRHGDIFVFVQNGALNATPPLEFAPTKPEENRVRVGTSLGGALLHEKNFFYVAAEQEIAHGEESSDLPPATLQQINEALTTTGLLHGVLLQPGFIPTSDQETELSGRLDRALTGEQTATLRYAFSNARNGNDAFNADELSDRSARGSSFLADHSLNGTLSSTLHRSNLNRLSFEVAQRRAVERTAETTTPGILIPGVALFGTPPQGNSRRFETHLDLEDHLLVQLGHHLLQAGVGDDLVRLRSEVLDGQRGLFVFPSLAALTDGSPDAHLQSFFSQPRVKFSEPRLQAYVQDHWMPTPQLTVDAGVRYDGNLLPAPLPRRLLHVSPRLGVAWSPTRSLVLRAGFGIFLDRFLLSTVNRILQLDGVHGFTQIVEGQDAADLYRGLPLRLRSAVAPSIWTAQAGLRNSSSEVASIGVEQALPFQSTLKAEYQYVRGVHLGRTANVNLLPPTVLTLANASSLGIESPTAQQLGRPVFSQARANPAYDGIFQFATTAASTYHGATLTVNRQFTDDLQILAGYTFSKTLDDASADTEQPQNPYALREERGPSLQDLRHRLTLSGLWLLGPDLNDPQDAIASAHPGRLMRLVTGLEFAPILSVSSGFRANPVTGVDSNREHVVGFASWAPFAARPRGLSRNALITPATLNLDLRVLKMFPVRGGHLDVVAESFNLPNHPNVSLLNTTYGSGDLPQAGFGRPTATSSARRIQFSLDYEF